MIRPVGSSLRFGLAFGGLFGVSTLIIVLLLWWAMTGLLERQADDAIRSDGQGLVQRMADGGRAAVLDGIGTRLVGNVDDDAVYLLLDASGRRLAGNLPAWPAAVGSPGRSYAVLADRHGATIPVRMQRSDLQDGSALLVGRDMQARAALLQPLAETLLGALLILLGLGLGGGLLVQRLFTRMLSNIAATASAISNGDLSQRVRLSGRGDEFDRVAEAINDMLDRIERLMDGVRGVSNAIAHDLRTPITRARARLESAVAQGASGGALACAVQQAVQDLDGVTAVFQALLRIAEIEAGASRSAFAAVDLVPLLQDMVELYGPVAEERALGLSLDAPGRLMMQGDRAMLQQAVANLLDNAIKFSPPGGTVRVVAGPGCRVAVVDQGPGIPAADRPRAAERFFRADQARNAPGFGLGLTLVQAVAALHGGALLLEDANPGLRAVLALDGASGQRERLLPERDHEHVPVRRLVRV